jgi:hypothetical protein
MLHKKTMLGDCERCQDHLTTLCNFSFYPYNILCGKCYKEIIDYINGYTTFCENKYLSINPCENKYITHV